MTGTEGIFKYAAFGWSISSDFELPLLRQASMSASCPDIRIRKRPVAPADISRVRFRSRSIYDQLRYVVDAGCEIAVEPLKGSSPANVSSLIVSRLLTVACYHRGLLPLHASAVRFGGRLVAICGVSGAGKSTLAAMLVERGAELFDDDMLVVAGTGPFYGAGPGAGGMKLSETSLREIGRDAVGLELANEVEKKFFVPVAPSPPARPVIAKIVHMRKGHRERRAASPVEAFAGWKTCVRQPELIAEAPDPNAIWQTWMDLVANTDNVFASHGGNMAESARTADALVRALAA